MKEIIGIIIEYVAIWAPSLVAILGVVATILTALNKTKEAWNKLKEDTDFKNVKNELKAQSSQNEELIRCNKLLLDEITKIHNYVEAKKREE